MPSDKEENSRDEKEMSKGNNNEEPVNRFGGANHEEFETYVHFMLLEHNLNLPAEDIMGKNLLIKKGNIRANKGTKDILLVEGILGIRQQNSSLIDPVEFALITMDPILVTALRNEVVLVFWELGSIIPGIASLIVRVENAVGFYGPNERNFLLFGLIP